MSSSINHAAAIAADSFRIIRAELAERQIVLAPNLSIVIERVIHTTADFDFAVLTRASPGAIDSGVAALRRGCPILTDVQMVRMGISARRVAALGGTLHCLIDHDAIGDQPGLTRSAAGIRAAHRQGILDGAIVAVGNAPTALFALLDLVAAGVRPALVIGVPVGFVNTVESKAALMTTADVPWIVTTGRKGGSTVAVAIVNALLRVAMGHTNTDLD
jgi:precorrin-8X/cobalt-precorrin-8 methylmutase